MRFSKSCSMEAIVAILPASAMSIMSAPGRGCRRTLSPGRSSMPAERTFSRAFRSCSGSRESGMGSLLEGRLHPANGTVKRHELITCQGRGSLQKSAYAFIDRGCLGLFLIGKRHDPQRKDLIDFCSIEKIAWAFWCD